MAVLLHRNHIIAACFSVLSSGSAIGDTSGRSVIKHCTPNSNTQDWHCQFAQQNSVITQQALSTENPLSIADAQTSDSLATGNIIVDTVEPEREDWQWVPLDKSLHRSTIDKKTRVCDGTYLAPTITKPTALIGALPINASAGRVEKNGDSVQLQGGVSLSRGTLSITGQEAVITQRTGLAKVLGGIEIEHDALLITGESAEINSKDGIGAVNRAEFLSYDSGLRGRAKAIRRESEQRLVLEKGHYTSCPIGSDTWHLAASTLTLDESSGEGSAKNARLVLGKVPIFYVPYMTFPIDDRRRSGVLIPTIGTADQGNIDFALPYYMNLGKNHDATYTPRFIDENGLLNELEFRYLGKSGAWVFDGAFISGDDFQERVEDIAGVAQFEDTNSDRWRFITKQQANISRRWRTNIDYTEVSDNELLDDFYSSSFEVRRAGHLNQQAVVDYISPEWQASVQLQQFQTIDLELDPQYKTLPQLTVDKQNQNKNFALNTLFSAETTHFDHRLARKDGGTLDTGLRFYTEAGATLPMRWNWGYIQSTVKMRHVSYRLDSALGSNDNIETSNNIPLYSIDSGLFFERSLNFKNTRYTHTFEPRVFYLNSRSRDQSRQPIFDTSTLTFNYNQLFRETRFTGRDRISDANQLTLAFTSRLIDSDNQRELGTLRVGQISYFSDREITAGDLVEEDLTSSTSDVAAEISFHPQQNLRFDTSLVFSPDFDQTNLGSIGVEYQPANDWIFNFNYRFRRGVTSLVNTTRLEQADFGTVFPLNNKWNLFARWRYDLTGERSIEDLFGLQYEDCCWSIRMVYNRQLERVDDLGTANASSLDNLDRDRAFHIEFEFKGLGSIGRRTSLLLEQSIIGFKDD